MKNAVYTIFGATGDLAYRKLMPAFYNLFSRGLLGENTVFLALGRRPWDKEDYLAEIRPWVEKFARFKVTDESFAAFGRHVDFLEMDFTREDDYGRLFNYYGSLAGGPDSEARRYIFYFAVAPKFFPVISSYLLNTGCLRGECRVIIEKPFGRNLEEAKAITQKLSEAFGENQVYHIDHYLGKEMVLNISTLRRENAIFRASWNREFVDSVELSALEELDIGSRGSYYDETGALKDMIQGHLFQVLTILAMEPVDDTDSSEFRRAQEKLLEAVRLPEGDIRGQLALGQYEGYRESRDVDPKSTVETYAALKVLLDNERWQGVPFYLRSGKALRERKTFVTVNFKKFGTAAGMPNRLHIEIQPQEGIGLTFNIKKPGTAGETETVNMNFCQNCRLDAHSNTPEAYERLLLAACEGKSEYFTPWRQIETSWNWMDRLRQLRDEAGLVPELYPKGSWGPAGADRLLARNGRAWVNETEILT